MVAAAVGVELTIVVVVVVIGGFDVMVILGVDAAVVAQPHLSENENKMKKIILTYLVWELMRLTRKLMHNCHDSLKTIRR